MRPLSSWLPNRPLLQRHMARLRHSLDDLAERLRDGLSRSVGESVARAVQEVLRRLIDCPMPITSPVSPVRPQTWGRPRWEEEEEACSRPYRPPWDEEREEEYPDDRFEGEEEEDRQPSRTGSAVDPGPTQADAVPTPSRWPHAIAAGCQTAAWWLRRATGKFVVLTAGGIGLAVAAAAYATGPLVAVAGAGVVGAAVGLLGLTEALSASAASLSP